MFKRIFAIIVLISALGTTSQAANWKIDVVHSSVGFSVRHLVISKVKGNFKNFSGNLEFDGKDLSKSSVEFAVHTSSVNTENEDRDKHLQSPDFFDSEKYPSMTFNSKNIHDINGNSFKLTGDLTIKNNSKEVTFDCMFNGIITDPWGNTRTGFSAKTKINRQDFKITWSKALETGGLIVGDEVGIEMELELVREKEAVESVTNK